MQSSSDAVRRFQPAVEPRLDGGECLTLDAPPIPGLPEDARLIQLRFPSRAETHTIVGVIADAEGRLLRYSEMRGVPPPHGPDLEAARREMANTRSTNINADLVQNRAYAVNHIPGQPLQGVRGPIAEFEHVGLLAGFRERADAVLEACSPR